MGRKVTPRADHQIKPQAVYVWYALEENRKWTPAIAAVASGSILVMVAAGATTFALFPCSGGLELHYNSGLVQWFYRWGRKGGGREWSWE